MSIVLYHHPQSRAASVVWMLEEVGCDYEIQHVDLRAGAQRTPEFLALNPMGKLPVLVDGDAVVTETAAIGVYLADRHAPGRLAPALDDPARGTFLRWSFFAPSVLEPACMARAAEWTYRDTSAGWGRFEAVVASLEQALASGPWLLGERFSMADVILGGTIRYMLRFEMLPPNEAFTAYASRLSERPALQRAEARNAAILRDLGES